MRIIKDEYRSLKPTIKYLSNEIVIAQSWKKTHSYIRSFNWYADTLALDVSALNIESNAISWSEDIKSDITLTPLELIPAVKSESWGLTAKGWKPIEKRDFDNPPLRPLAHLSVRDQTFASTVLLCLADAVETKQGNCSLNFSNARSRHVYSYGNRLVCDWNDSVAWFRWGNSEMYRKFYTDYQNFLQRPLELGREAKSQVSVIENVYIVSLDLSKFYNNIDVAELINRLKEISDASSLYPSSSDNIEFWNKVEKILGWEWDPDALIKAEQLKLGNIKNGLPQGLASAGFFANAYLTNFDSKVGETIGETIDETYVKLHDYCRYVDDLRLVVSAEGLSLDEVKSIVNKFIDEKLKSFGGKDLSVNPKKTKINLLSDLDNPSSMANRIDSLQSELSGPADRDSLSSTSAALEGLLSIGSEPKILDINTNDSGLFAIANFDHDIGADTLKRFAANRLEHIARSKRKLITEKETHIQEAENELLAKKLSSAWMNDPSLTIVLRKAFEVYPEAELFEPLIEAIFSRSSFANKKTGKNAIITSQMMDYLLADLFRCASDFKGVFQYVSYPKTINPSSLIDLISKYAQKVIRDSNCPEFLMRQALLLLAIDNKPVLLERATKSIQLDLHHILVNSLPHEYKTSNNALFEVAAQITGKFDSYASLFVDYVNSSNKSPTPEFEIFAKRGGEFWLSLWKQLKKGKLEATITSLKWAIPLSISSPKPQQQSLAKVISSNNNGFRFEHGLIKLGLGLLHLIRKPENVMGCSPHEISVKVDGLKDWSNLWSSHLTQVDCSYNNKNLNDPRFKNPIWIDENSNENISLYWIGTILRAASVGGSDFTSNSWKKSDITTYKGLRTNWYKRRMGMMHSPESLVDEYATVSDWFSDLLKLCLQWPGVEATFLKSEDIKNISNLKSFEVALTKRLSYLNSLICVASNVPAIPTIINRPLSSRDLFRIVTVQQLLPKSSSFHISDVKLNNHDVRATHREHVAAICKLTEKTLEAKLHADGVKKKPSADLIVFPELAIHIDDQDLIKRLADKTNAIIFAGLVFTDYQGKVVNKARWFIPDYQESGRQWRIRDQGKYHMTDSEVKLGISGFRPCQHILEVHGHPEGPFRMTGAICYDATDINLAADLRDKTDLFVITAYNQDVNTFDNMAVALQWHMYQHVVISNIGEFGGSTIQAPYKERYDRLISHAHGTGQIAISTADIDLAAFKRKVKDYKAIKTKPAGAIR